MMLKEKLTKSTLGVAAMVMLTLMAPAMFTTGAFAQSEPPLTIKITINPTAYVNPRTGEVTVSGTVQCSNTEPEQAELTVHVTQTIGDKTIQGTILTIASCFNGETVPWTATVQPDNGRFVPGGATVSVTAFLCTDTGCIREQESASVQLTVSKSH